MINGTKIEWAPLADVIQFLKRVIWFLVGQRAKGFKDQRLEVCNDTMHCVITATGLQIPFPNKHSDYKFE